MGMGKVMHGEVSSICILLYTIETCEVANSVENFHRNCYMAALDKNVCFVLFAQYSHML